MSPTLEDGDYVLTVRSRRIRKGLVYIINHIDQGMIIKRCVGQSGDNYMFVGDGVQTIPEKLIGFVEAHRVAGRAILRIGRHHVNRL
ncbi:MAG: S24/S26 family peptidase [Hyphomonadaceae bacterium]|nr:S24/S26 family peptidase [Hyphomonadaceae bacterium]MBC6411635.1 S24/S26 family peptidase [Hyphomonadaceae bacterium]